MNFNAQEFLRDRSFAAMTERGPKANKGTTQKEQEQLAISRGISIKLEMLALARELDCSLQDLKGLLNEQN